ncbi:N-acyl homoserine lactonase family protein [Rhodococcus opacus]|nr:N-acyl homoserine lactonase family protein [Rhodococcus opacus]
MRTVDRLGVVVCGAMHCDRSSMVVGSNSAGPNWVESPSLCVLVETSAGTVLWDTSCPRDWRTRWEPQGGNLANPYDLVGDDEYLDVQLNNIGVGLDEIDYVVFSHLHIDHAGNGHLFKDTNAKLICSADEKEFAFGFDGPFAGGHLKRDYEDLSLETVSGDTEILPGVTLIQAPGHTVGSMAMQVDLEDSGTMIFTSDSVFLGENFGPPVAKPGFVTDLRMWFASVEKLRQIQERTDATMVFGHDAEQVPRLKRAPEMWYV